MKNHKSLFIKTFVVAAAVLCASAALAWTGPLTSPPTCTTGNPGCDAPLNISNSAQTKTGGSITEAGGNLIANGGGAVGGTSVTAGAGGLCLPGSLPSGGCITTWTSAGSSVWTLTGRGSGFNYNSGITSAAGEAGTTKWVDGGGNSNGPTNGGNTSGALLQFDPLWNSVPDNYKIQMLDPTDGNLYWRFQSAGTWQPWQQLIQANAASGIASVPGYLQVGTSSTSFGIVESIGFDSGVQAFDRTGNGQSSLFYRSGNTTALWDSSAGNVLQYSSGGFVGIGGVPDQKLTVMGTVHSTSGGIEFPDGTVQTTAAGGAGVKTFGGDYTPGLEANCTNPNQAGGFGNPIAGGACSCPNGGVGWSVSQIALVSAWNGTQWTITPLYECWK